MSSEFVQAFKKRTALGDGFEDFIITRADYDSESKRLVSFSASQFFRKDDKEFEVIRFDTSHGFLHVHKFYRDRKDSGEELAGWAIDWESFRKCRQEIFQNWQVYKARFFEKHFP